MEKKDEVRFETLHMPWPLTIVLDRYGGVYSGAKFLAFNKYYGDVPNEICGDDPTEMDFWDANGRHKHFKIGKGDTPNDAVISLVQICYDETNLREEKLP